MKPNDLSIPWTPDQYYIIDYTKYAYETHAGLDFIWLYDLKGKMYIGDIISAGHHVIPPKENRRAFSQQIKTKTPSAASVSYYK